MSERSYRCLICQDEGVVVVINPAFMRHYRETYELELAEGRGGEVGIYDRVHRFWRRHPDFPRFGPLNHSAICCCDCKRSLILVAELEKFKRGERINKEKRNVAPAAGWVWDRGLAPLWPGPVDSAIWRSISDFYSGRLF